MKITKEYLENGDYIEKLTISFFGFKKVFNLCYHSQNIPKTRPRHTGIKHWSD